MTDTDGVAFIYQQALQDPFFQEVGGLVPRPVLCYAYLVLGGMDRLSAFKVAYRQRHDLTGRGHEPLLQAVESRAAIVFAAALARFGISPFYLARTLRGIIDDEDAGNKDRLEAVELAARLSGALLPSPQIVVSAQAGATGALSQPTGAGALINDQIKALVGGLLQIPQEQEPPASPEPLAGEAVLTIPIEQ